MIFEFNKHCGYREKSVRYIGGSPYERPWLNGHWSTLTLGTIVIVSLG